MNKVIELQVKKMLAHMNWRLTEYLKGNSVWTLQEVINGTAIDLEGIEGMMKK